ncbi:pilus assembly protein [Acidovorax sp. BL-A-41-H1]|uniref:pilus assembly protein n=1 Tax=Acidovorax sp. BL-A-41-H1 TaxID=3421102 RepID=UPI003F795E84
MIQAKFGTHSRLRRLGAAIVATLPATPVGWFGWTALPLAIVASFVAFSQSTPPAFPAVNLANQPLYAATTVDKPTLALALSVEFPTVGAQYLDGTYSSANEYLGYYDAESCYNYNNAPTETATSPLTTADYKRFDRSGPATNRTCANAFSGNFLNWASSSAIDMLRLALSGGDRYIDTPDLTILQRAVIPNGDPICMWNSGNFPAKRLLASGGGAGAYWGAVPTAMITQANGNDIWVANTLNRIYFKAGTAADGGCGNTGTYTLGGPVSGNQIESPIRTATALPLTGMTLCIAGETGTCSFSGIKEVWYGAGTSWRVAAANNGVNCTSGCNAVFGDPAPGLPKTVYFRNYTGTWTPPTTGTLNSDGFFYSRVQVCNVNGSGVLQDSRDYGLCKQYPNGKYKPVGVIQKYSDQMRLAAFGYLMDQTASYNAGRYGGVLRAPMKYVGTKTFDINGNDNTPSGGNAAAEWSATTGVFTSNPDGDTTQNPPISGVINYLNKFGRTGPVPGRYKRFDPVGELHYETLRYLQGLPPSADAISNMTAAMQDGFPVYTTWDDPYGNGRTNASDYSCVKSNIVVVGDVNTHDGNRLPTPSAANNIPDIAGWRGIADRFERNSGGTYVDGQGVTRTITNPNPANTSMPTGSQTSQIIGSAYWSHIKDIRGSDWTDAAKRRPGLRVKTIIFDVNENGGATSYATRSTRNQFFMAAKYGGFETDPANQGGRPYNTYGNPFKRQDGTDDNAVWRKAAAPGDASSYYLQSNARGVLSAFDEIFSRAASAARSIAGSAASGDTVSSGTARYTARFDTSNWSGDVVAEPISVNTTTNALVVGAPIWSAANRLDTRTSPATTRNIVVGKESGTANPPAMDFTWGAIDTTLQTHLGKLTPASAVDTLGEDRLNYIRGSRIKEGNPFRVRSSLMGDVVNSTVAYSGPPSLDFSGAGYVAFRTANANRTPAVFAGANDGMLHAFNATNGDELFGYIPSWLGPKLSALPDPGFATSHQNYVDAPIAVGEAQVASAGLATDWKTVLVSGTGGGGSGVFALDVTDPTAFSASKVMWEFKRTDDPDIGQVIGQPRIMKFKISGTASTPTYRWFAVVASGVNNYVPDAGNRFSTNGKPAIFLLALDKAQGTAWAEGTNYYKIPVPVNTTLAATLAPGVVNFNALYGSAGEVTDIYFGDMHGNFWKLSFAPANVALSPSDWTMDKLSFFNKGTAAAPIPYPMFIAKNAAGTSVQPITAAPTIFTGPVVGGVETFYVSFGTGKYLEASDNTSTLTNSFYTIYDNGSSAADSSPAGDAAISGRGRLMAGSVNTTTKAITVSAFTWGRPASDATTTSRAGWYFDLPSTGEKAVSRILDLSPRNGTFNTVIPGAAGSTAGSCSNAPGTGNRYAINIQTGASTFVTSTLGIPGPSIFFVNSAEITETKSDSTGRRIRTIVKREIADGTEGSAPGSTVTVNETVGRLVWRQIYNYQDMKN